MNAAAAGPARYAYDAAGRLVGVAQENGETAQYRYDPAGNVVGVNRFPSSRLSVLSVVPAAARPGDVVTVSGTGFSATGSSNTVRFNGVAGQVTDASSSTLKVKVPDGVSAGPVTVTVGTSTATGETFRVAAAAPVITSFTPTSGPPSTTVTVSGSGFAPGLADNVVSVNGMRAEVTAATATSLQVVVPAGLASGKIRVATAEGEATSADDFTIPLDGVDTGSIESVTRVQVGGASPQVAIAEAGKSALVLFEVPASGRVDLGLTGSTLGLMDLWVYDYQGRQVLRTFTSNANSSLHLRGLKAERTYQLLVNPDAAAASGQVMVTASQPLSGALSATGAGTATSLQRPGQSAALSFTGAGNTAVSLGFTANTVTSFINVRVLDQAGEQVGVSRWISPETSDDAEPFRLPSDGRYTVELDTDDAATGTFTTTLSNRAAGGVLVLNGGAASAAITRPGQDASYTFAGTEGQRLTLDAIGVASFGDWVNFLVYQPDGTQLGGTRFLRGDGSVDIADLPATGTYTVVVDPDHCTTGQISVALGTRPTAFKAPAKTRRIQDNTGSKPKHPVPGSAAPGTGEAPDRTPASWTPDTGNLRGVDWGVRRAEPKKVDPPMVPAGQTAVSGVVRTIDGKPLPRVAVSIDRATARSDARGRFLLTAVPPGARTLVVDGGPAGRKGRRYGLYSIKVDVAAGRTTALPYIIWMTQLDTQHMVRFDSPTKREIVLTNPKIPGLQVRIPKGAVIRDKDGKVVTELGITPIPVDRPPFPLPPNGIVPTYFTVQPGGTYLFPEGAQIIYPNYTHLPAGKRVDFWNYDPEHKGWYVYGKGTVSADARRVVPDATTKVWAFHGAMFNTDIFPPWAGKRFKDLLDWLTGDPVDPATGLMVDSRTDLAVDDVLPIQLSRTLYGGDTHERGFGIGQTGEYDLFLHSENQSQYQEVDLYLPGGQSVHYVRTSPGTGYDDAEFEARGTPSEYRGSRLVRNNPRRGWDLIRRDGTRYFFPEYAPLAEISDRNSNTITLSRDTDFNVRQITSPNGKWIKLDYDANGRVRGARDNIGRTVSYTYGTAGGENGRLKTVTDPGGKTLSYTYDSAGRLKTATDARGIVYLTNDYDSAGRVSKQTLTNNRVYTFAYTTGTGGRITETRVTQPDRAVRRFTFDALGAVASVTEAYGTASARTITLTRGTEQRVDAVTDPAGRKTTYHYDSEGRPTHITRLAGTADAIDGPKTTYGAFDLPVTITNELGDTTRYDYDDHGNLTKITDPLGRITQASHTGDGQPLSVTDSAGKVSTNTYRLGDLVTTTDSLGNTTRLFHDAAGRLTSTIAPNGATATATYDARNQLITSTDPLGHTFTRAYDANGNPTALTDPRGNTLSWDYDDSDRLIKATDALGKSAITEYYGNDLPAKTTSRAGKVTTFLYDLLNKPTQIRYGVTGDTAQSTVAFTYDPAHGDQLHQITDTAAAGPTTLGYDALDRLTQTIQPTGTLTNTYDDADQRTTAAVTGQTPVTYGWDDSGALATLTQGSVTATPHYDSAGRQDRIDLPGGWTRHYTFNNGGQVTGITHRHNGTDKGTLTYTYDPVGQISAITGTAAKIKLPEAISGLVYDDANRLTDHAGTPLTYDADGNLTGDGITTYSWNARGQLTGLSGPGLSAAFRYNALGERDRRTVGPTTTGFLNDSGNPIAETDAAGTVTANLLSGGLDEWFARTPTNGFGTQTYLTDLQGSVNALGDADGTQPATYAYDPYGNPEATGTTGGNTLTYTGRQDDGTGLMYYRARYYSPTLNRFISEDPAGISGGANLYAYTDGDPVNATDPTGNHPVLLACLVGAAIDGGIELGIQKLSGRKNYGQIVSAAAVGCGAGALSKAFSLWRLGRHTKCITPNSFTGDTLVLMADGSRKPIKDVKVGDRVLATDPETGKTESRAVLDTIASEGDKNLVQVTINSNAPIRFRVTGDKPTQNASTFPDPQLSKSNSVTATDNHPFWVGGDINAWTKATDLKPGMWLRTSAGTYVQITAVQRWPTRHQLVHNLTIDRRHTYYVDVGSTPVLVHNDKCLLSDVGTASDNIVLGSRDDTLTYSYTPGHLVLDDPGWSPAGNMDWIRRAAAARRTFRLVTPLTRDNLWDAAANRPKVYRLEIIELLKQGYRFSPDRRFMLPPP